MMVREKIQIVVLLIGVAALLFAIARIYETQVGMTPASLDGTIAAEGGPTANTPN